MEYATKQNEGVGSYVGMPEILQAHLNMPHPPIFRVRVEVSAHLAPQKDKNPRVPHESSPNNSSCAVTAAQKYASASLTDASP